MSKKQLKKTITRDDTPKAKPPEEVRELTTTAKMRIPDVEKLREESRREAEEVLASVQHEMANRPHQEGAEALPDGTLAPPTLTQEEVKAALAGAVPGANELNAKLEIVFQPGDPLRLHCESQRPDVMQGEDHLFKGRVADPKLGEACPVCGASIRLG